MPKQKEIQPEVTSETLEAARQAFLKERAGQVSKVEDAIDDSSLEQLQNEPEPIKKSIPQEKEPELTSVEREAMESGWVPKDEFKGDKSKWRPAEEWINRDRWDSSKISEKRELAELKRQQKEILEILKQERQEKIQLKISELKQQKREAIKNADIEEVDRLDSKIAEINGVYPSSIEPKTVQQPPISSNPPEIDAFIKRNPWFRNNAKMYGYAVKLSSDLSEDRPDLSLTEILDVVEKETLEAFNYGKQEKRNVAPVYPRTGSEPRNTVPKYDNLPMEAKNVIDHYYEKAKFNAEHHVGNKKPTIKSKEMYIKELFEANVIDKSGNLI